jgi:hypothetical protein
MEKEAGVLLFRNHGLGIHVASLFPSSFFCRFTIHVKDKTLIALITLWSDPYID